jgi:hypothetical protein
MSDHPTLSMHESELADYHPDTAAPSTINNRGDLELAFAHAMYGSHVDSGTPIGLEVVNTIGRELVAPYVDALLRTPGLHITYAPGQP